MIKYIREILLVILLLWIAGKYVFETPEVITETQVDTVYTTIEVPIEAEPKIEYKVIKEKDTTGLAELNSLIDSLQQELNNSATTEGIGEYTATVDTTVTDEAGNSLADISFTAVSRIPFDPKLKFRGQVNIHQPTITSTTNVYHGQSFWDRFSIGINISAGYGVFSRNWDVYAGVGFNFDIN